MKFLNYIMHTHSKKRSINVTTVGGSDKVYNETPYGVKQFKGTPAKCDSPPIIHVLEY
jgi:hypothetical protein